MLHGENVIYRCAGIFNRNWSVLILCCVPGGMKDYILVQCFSFPEQNHSTDMLRSVDIVGKHIRDGDDFSDMDLKVD